MVTSYKTCLLILPFFGRFNEYFQLWLTSVRNNPTIDFLIITDNHSIEKYPNNVRVVYMSFEELKQLFQNHFDFTITLDNPYKLCDYKPAYGIIFQKYLVGYDFWGHCDCDLIFGNIRRFITNDILSYYDRILTLGHLCVYRNTIEVNKMFMKKIDGVRFYKDVYQSVRIHCFDEYCGATPIWNHISPEKVYEASIYDDIDYSQWAFHPIGIKKASHIFYEYDNGQLYRVYKYNDGLIKTEICYVHFQKRDMKASILKIDDVEHFCAIPNSFVSYDFVIKNIDSLFRKELFYFKPFKVKMIMLFTKVRLWLRRAR